MSTNLIYNGDFSLPSITTNSSLNSTSFTTQQATDFYWTCGGAYAQLLNGVPTSNFLNPSLVGYTQSCYLLYASSIQQSFTVPFAGSYILSFYYSIRTGFPLNNMQILINGVLFDTITTTPTNWSRYMNTVSNVNLGVNTILFQATSGGNAIVFTGVSFVFGQVGAATPLTIATYNNFKTTNINGSLTVLDWIPTGKGLIQGTISTQRNYNYNYTTLPTFYSTALGYINSYTTTTATSPTANSFISHATALSIPIGVYIVDAYCLFTPSTSAIHTLKLGINTISGAITSLNYTIENTLTASILPHSIQYKYILSVAAATNYYFVFNPSIAGSIAIGGFNGKFIRIA
jgi:hypothetical protein